MVLWKQLFTPNSLRLARRRGIVTVKRAKYMAYD